MDDELSEMSTDGSTPPPCDPKIFSEGVQVFMTDTIPSNAMEYWVKQVAEISGQPVDWHFAGSRARVLALGDIERVQAVIAALMPEHDLLRRVALDRLFPRE